MKLNQERERIKEGKKKKIKKRRRRRQLTRQESDPPVEMCATAGTTLIIVYDFDHFNFRPCCNNLRAAS